MAFVSADRISDTTTVTGTGNVTVSGVAPTGYKTFSTVLSVGDTFYYCISDQTSGKWETGIGTYLSANVFARTTVLSSSNSNSAVAFTDGTKSVFMTFPAEKMLQTPPNTVGASAANVVSSGGITSRTLAARANDIFNVKDFGAVGDGVANDTTAIQAAIAAACTHTVNGSTVGGTIYFPAGNYKFTSTLTITANNVYLKGDGPGASFLFPAISATADAIYFASGCQRVGMLDIAVYNAISDPTAGAMVHLYKNNLVFLSNVDVSAGFYGIWIDGTVHSYGVNVNITGDANMTSAKSGSALMYVTSASGTIPSELHFSNCDWRGQTGNNYLNYAIYIQCCDGLWLNSVHLGFCQIGLGTSPSSSTAPILSIIADQLYLDTCSQYGAALFGFSYTGMFGLHSLNFATVYNCPIGIAINCPSTDWSFINGGFWNTITQDAIQLYSGSKWRVQNVTAYNINTGNIGGCGVNVGAGFSDFTIDGLLVQKDGGAYSPNCGIYLTTGASNFKIGANNKFTDCTTDISDNTTVTTKSIDAWMTNKTVSSYASAATFSMPVQPYFVMTGTTTITALSGIAWEGRQVMVVTTGGAVSFTAGATIANNFTSTQNVPFTCFYTGGKWHI